MKKLTIITVCLNIASTIERTCQSIVNQTFQDFEWIVVDGASTDGTLQILEKYRNRIDILISEPDKGIYNAMNKGIKLATGEYLLFLNGGDKLNNNTVLEEIKDQFDDYPIITCNLNILNCNGEYEFTWKPQKEEDFYYKTLPHQSTFIQRKLFKKYGLYDEKLTICADREFFVKTIAKFKQKFKIIDINCSDFYTDGVSCTNDSTRDQNNRVIKNRYFWWRLFIDEHPQIKEKIEFIRNCVFYPRFFLGYIKKNIFK